MHFKYRGFRDFAVKKGIFPAPGYFQIGGAKAEGGGAGWWPGACFLRRAFLYPTS